MSTKILINKNFRFLIKVFFIVLKKNIFFFRIVYKAQTCRLEKPKTKDKSKNGKKNCILEIIVTEKLKNNIYLYI